MLGIKGRHQESTSMGNKVLKGQHLGEKVIISNGRRNMFVKPPDPIHENVNMSRYEPVGIHKKTSHKKSYLEK